MVRSTEPLLPKVWPADCRSAVSSGVIATEGVIKPETASFMITEYKWQSAVITIVVCNRVFATYIKCYSTIREDIIDAI